MGAVEVTLWLGCQEVSTVKEPANAPRQASQVNTCVSCTPLCCMLSMDISRRAGG